MTEEQLPNAWPRDLPLDRTTSNCNGGPARVELRQLRYFVTLAEMLHFGRAAAREHIVQSALSQQVQRLERALGVALVERSTRRVRLTEAGRRFVIEARQILAHVDRAIEIAQHAARSTTALRVGVVDESYATMQPILAAVQDRHPELEIHQVQAGAPEQLRLLSDGHLDVGVGLAAATPPDIASELVRLDPLGVLVPAGHHLAALSSIPVAKLMHEPLLFADVQRAPEYNQLIMELCQSGGFEPQVYRGTVQSLRAAADLVDQGRCMLVVPVSCVPTTPGVVWRPLEAPSARFSWFIWWRAGKSNYHVAALVRCARELSRQYGWLDRAGGAAG